jgi:steroid delta-isomerase-like uncharacterized protein
MSVTRKMIEETLKVLNEAENMRPNTTVEGTIAAIDETMAPEVEGWNPRRGHTPNRAAERRAEGVLFEVIQDYHRTFERIVADPPFAAFDWKISGTSGGKALEIFGCSIGEFNEQGKILRYWLYMDPSQLPSRLREPSQANLKEEQVASSERNKAIIYHLIEQWNKGNLAVFDECFADSFTRCGQGVPNMDKAGYKRFCSMIMRGNPDIQMKIDDIIAEGDRVAFCWTLTGTNTAESFGKPPTGKRFSITEDYFVRFADGKIVEFKNLIGASPS